MLRIAVIALALAAASAPIAGLSSRALTPAPPVLTPFDGKSHTDTYLLEGEVDSVRAGSWVRVLRNGVVIDSTSAATDTLFAIRVKLVPGYQTLTAVYRDAAFNVSAPSNIVSVRFDDSSGLFVPVPFVPGASFDLNPVTTAVKAELRVFDVTGDLVIGFESREPRTFYSFVWDGKNGSFENVRRGLLVAVGAIDYPDGTHSVMRQVFLFDPEPTR